MGVRMAVIGVMGGLAGCAMAGPAQPVAARLSPDLLVVSLSDGTRCVTPWAAGAGRLAGCGAGYDWQVTVDPRPNPLRMAFVELTAALGAAGAVPPMAEVVLTDASGRVTRLVSPPPVDPHPHDRL